MIVEIRFDGAWAEILTPLPKGWNSALKDKLSWVNKATQYAARSQGRRMNCIEYCYDVKSQKFRTGLLLRVIDELVLLDPTLDFEYICLYQMAVPTLSPCPDWAYAHQKKIVEAVLTNPRGIVSSPTGSGKGNCAAFICDQFPDSNILVVTPNENLLTAMMATLGNYLSMEIGRFDGNKHDIKRITVGSTKSLGIHAEAQADWLASINVLIIDECQQAATASALKFSDACYQTSYRIGLSATPRRADGADLVSEGVLGPLIAQFTEKEMVSLGVIHAPNVYFIPVPVPATKDRDYVKKINARTGEVIREEIYKGAIVNNSYRNGLCIKLLQAFISSPRLGVCVIFVERIEHGTNLQELAKRAGIDLPFIDGSTVGKERKNFLDSLRSGDIKYCVASSVLDVGEDIPNLELGILAGGNSGEGDLTQRLGRTVRKDKSGRKLEAFIVEFLDAEPHYMKNNALTRKQTIIKRYGPCVIDTDLNTVIGKISKPGLSPEVINDLVVKHAKLVEETHGHTIN